MASDMSQSRTALLDDFLLIRGNASSLSPELYYLAGLCQSITGLQLKVLEKFLALVGRARRADEVSEQEYLGLCVLVKEGRLGDAKNALEACRIASMRSIREALPPPVQEPKVDISEVVRKIEAEERAKEEEAKRKSEELARRLQQQYQREVEAMAEAQARLNTTCQKCKAYAPQHQSIRECGHIYHPRCLEESLSPKIREGVYPLTCPTNLCTAELTLNDFSQLKPAARQLVNIAMQGFTFYRVHPESMLICPTPGCNYKVYFQGQTELYCPECGNRFCLRCRSPLHLGTTCESRKPYLTSSDLARMFEFVKMGVPMKTCPACMLWNIKPTNQQMLTCYCGVRFCSKCGQRANTCYCRDPFAFR